MAGKITYMAPIDNASGKIFGKKQRFVAVTRVKGQQPRGCMVMGTRTSAPTADELTQRAIFKAASDYAKNTMLDPTKRRAAELRFKAMKEAGGKYTSLRTFLMGESFNGDEVA